MQDRVWNRARISGTDLWRKGVKFVANTGYYRGAYHCGQLKPGSLDLSGFPGSLFI